MADIKKLEEKRTGVSWLDPRILKVKPDLNVRMMDSRDTVAHVEKLADEIVAMGGVIKALEVFTEGDDIFVADGHCRLAAALLAIERGMELRAIPCVIEPKGTSAILRKLRQIPANGGRPLSLLEAGEAIKYAIAGGWTREKIAANIGKSLSYISQALDFQGADPEIHAHVKAGEISASAAAGVIRDVGAAAAPAVVREAVESAKVAGKTKATAKTIRPLTAHRTQTPGGPPVVCFGLGDVSFQQMSTLSAELNVTIKGTIFNGLRTTWEELANRILDALEGKKVA